MAGYSATPQARKLGIKPGLVVRVDGRPPGWEFEVPLANVEVVETGPADVLVAFCPGLAELGAGLLGWAEAIYPVGGLWVLWPRKAGGHVSDLTEDLIRDRALPLGLVDNKVAAVDADWSGLRVVWRRELRTAEHPPWRSPR